MDWNIVTSSIITGIITLILGYFGALKAAFPKLIEQRITERDKERESERAEREAKIREEAEKSAYERNRKATHEDRTFEMLHDTLEFIQERIEKDDKFRQSQLEQFAILVKSVSDLGIRYHNLYSQQQITNQQLALITDGLKDIRYSIDNGRKKPQE